MNSKAKISSDYMNGMKAEHAGKELPPFRNVLITGTKRKGSIGESIAENLRVMIDYTVTHNNMDVRTAELFEGVDEVDTLILCHGVTHLDWLEEATTDHIYEIIEVNLTSIIKIVGAFVRKTIDDPWRKQIIMIGSMAHQAVLNGSSAYCASKAGLAHFAKCAAWELAPKGYDVFIIHPSNTEGTPMTEDTIQGLMRYRGLTREEAEAYWGASLPKAQWLQPADIANLVVFLTSGKGEYLSGTQLDLPGGQR